MAENKHIATQGALAEYAGINRRTAHEWVHKADFPRKTRWGWKITDVDEWIAARSADAAEPLLTGQNTPALEEYRRWRAANEKLSYERNVGNTRWLDEVHLLLDRLSGAICNACETIQKQWGDEPVQILRDAFEDQRELINRMLGGDHASSDPSAHGTDDNSICNPKPIRDGLPAGPAAGDAEPDSYDAAVRAGRDPDSERPVSR